MAYDLPSPAPEPGQELHGVLLTNASEKQQQQQQYSISISDRGTIESIQSTVSSKDQVSGTHTCPIKADGLFALPSLCHPHVHLDKPYLLTHPTTCHLQPQTGSFKDALSITAKGKELYTPETVLDRMHMLLAESSRAGVTHVRGFAEVDATVRMIALDAAIEAQRAWSERLKVQICAFAQDPVYSGEHGDTTRALMEQAVKNEHVEVLGSTPYVESSPDKAQANVEWAIRTAIDSNLHLDFHLDYNVDEKEEPLVWSVLKVLRREDWVTRMPGKTVCLGHCTRLTLFTATEWTHLQNEVRSLPVYFVGLPTSDIFMMGRPSMDDRSDFATQKLAALADRHRCTLQVPAMIAAGLNACISINNIGNAFTPYGSADPLALAQWCTGIYQAGTAEAAELIFDCISRRAKEAIGFAEASQTSERKPGTLHVGDSADLVLIGLPSDSQPWSYRQRRTLAEIVWNAGPDRMTVFKGNWIKHQS